MLLGGGGAAAVGAEDEEDHKEPGDQILVATAKVNHSDLIHTNEQKQQKALENHYDNMKKRESAAREANILRWKRFSLITNPVICIAFVFYAIEP